MKGMYFTSTKMSMINNEELIPISEVKKLLSQYEDIENVSEFARRNCIDAGTNEKLICLKCLKAYFFSLVKDGEISPRTYRSLFSQVVCEKGHSGNYYLDEGVLKHC